MWYWRISIFYQTLSLVVTLYCAYKDPCFLSGFCSGLIFGFLINTICDYSVVKLYEEECEEEHEEEE